MARDDDSQQPGGPGTGTSRDRYRDNDDVRPIDAQATRNDVAPDSRNEARGDARKSVGRHARGTDADGAGPSGNDRQRSRSTRAEPHDDDLARDNRSRREGEGMSDHARDVRSGAAGFSESDRPAEMDALDDRHGWRSHARQGQAESPVELTHNEPPKRKKGHR